MGSRSTIPPAPTTVLWCFPWGTFRVEYQGPLCASVTPWEIPDLGFRHPDWSTGANEPAGYQEFESLKEFFRFWKKVRRAPAGTPFQNKVWDRLEQIPFGKTITYGEVARDINHPKAFQATGNAVGSNPWCLAVPCHRVLPSNGQVGNYEWGTPMKSFLLQKEGVLIL